MSTETRTAPASEIASIRARLGYSQAAMAEALGVAQPTIWRWEHGKAAPGKAHLHLARTLMAEAAAPAPTQPEEAA